jgi:hypothetical protein
MKPRPFYLLVAIFTFFIGQATVHVLRLPESVEDRLVTLIYPAPVSHALLNSQPVDERMEENAVYKVVFQKMYVDKNTKVLVIEATTTRCQICEGSEEYSASPPTPYASVQGSVPSAEPDTVISYVNKNKVASELLLGELGFEYRLVSEKTVNQYFSDTGTATGWTGFYKTYPDSPGLLSVSRVGFNVRHDQALVYVAHSCGDLCGLGSYILLKKQADQWVIERTEGLWIS